QAEDGIRCFHVTGVQTCALPICLKQCRIVVVTDRVDLETQLRKTFASGGELAGKKDKEAAMATSGKRLAEQIGKGTERIIFSLRSEERRVGREGRSR